MKTVIINTINGLTAVTFVNENKRKKGEGDKDLVNRLARKHFKEEYHLCQQDELPDLDFQNAWEIKSKKIKINMTKARRIHMERIREKRKKRFSELDIEQLSGKEIKEKKQALRDIPQTFDLTKAKNTDELKNLWPTELEGVE